MVNKKVHPKYGEMLSKWIRCRDAYSGSDAIKAKGETYLPRLDKQTGKEYEAYKRRALWYGATRRTVAGLLGSVFRVDPSVSGSDEELIDLLQNDVTMTRLGISGFGRLTFQDLLITGRAGILIDMPIVEGDAIAPRPYWLLYTAEEIVNWVAETVDGDERLRLLVLRETVAEEKERFVIEYVTQYRVLELSEEFGGCIVEVWRKGEGNDAEYYPSEPILLKRNGAPLDFIPFVGLGINGVTVEETNDPPLLDLVDLNVAHYVQSADLEHGRHYCGLPVLWRKGFGEDQGLAIGPNVVWDSNENWAEANWLEFTGQGLAALEKGLEEKEAKMSALGARMLEEPKKTAESAAAIRLRTSGEQSVLAAMAVGLGQGLTMAANLTARWLGAEDPDFFVEVNTDFEPSAMAPEEINGILAAQVGGIISRETAYWLMSRGEMTRPGVEWEEEAQKILAEDGGGALSPLPEPEPEEDAEDETE